jgi:hypothetical protein
LPCWPWSPLARRGRGARGRHPGQDGRRPALRRSVRRRAVVRGGPVGRISSNYDDLVDAVIASDGEAVYFAGCSEEAAALIRLLRIAGFTGKFIGDQGVRDAGFIQGRR